ncbi:MAG: hypothetical protein ACRYGI_15835 [Janthinobacterium lividum]
MPGRPFVPGISNQHILRLYECDMRLHDVCFAAVGQFELLLRNAISEALSDGVDLRNICAHHDRLLIAAFRSNRLLCANFVFLSPLATS